MSRYEFSLLQEVLMEKGAGVLGDLSQYKRQNGIVDRRHPVSISNAMTAVRRAFSISVPFKAATLGKN